MTHAELRTWAAAHAPAGSPVAAAVLDLLDEVAALRRNLDLVRAAGVEATDELVRVRAELAAAGPTVQVLCPACASPVRVPAACPVCHSPLPAPQSLSPVA